LPDSVLLSQLHWRGLAQLNCAGASARQCVAPARPERA
jgi:hypothetical protein